MRDAVIWSAVIAYNVATAWLAVNLIERWLRDRESNE